VTTLALVGRRQDFRESSRLVTLLSRELGKITVLAKGAHRPDSPCLGRLDFLNEVEATVGGDAGGLRLLLRIDLRRERRGLREPQRFLAASHLAWLAELVLPESLAEPQVFDLLQGGLALLERCPLAAIPAVVLGLELRLLQRLGALPDFAHCTACGTQLGATRHLDPSRGVLLCPHHAEPGHRRLPPGSGELLHTLLLGRGVDLPSQAGAAALRSLWTLPPQWLYQATEQRSRLRGLLAPPSGN
jgi:DNA repair protein RecO